MIASAAAFGLCVWMAGVAGEPTEPTLAASIVARVDDKAILREELLSPYRKRLDEAKSKLPPEQYQELEDSLVKQRVELVIQRLVIMKELELKVKGRQEVIERIRIAAAGDFEKHIKKIVQESGLKSRDELIQKLEAEGTTLESQQKDFIDNLLAQQFLMQMVRPKMTTPSRGDILNYYNSHPEEFAIDAGAVWWQIQVRHKDNQSAARQKIMAAKQRLDAGEPFEKVAKEMSEGPTAFEGGKWSKTSPGSYADPAVDQMIFSLPIGQVSGIIEGKESYQIIRVDQRDDAGSKPFETVQDEIQQRLQRRELEALQKAALKELMAKHFVETIFDEEEAIATNPDTPIRR